MIYKSRTKSTELLILESLHTRLNLTEKDIQHYSSLKKGYEGEVLFDSITEKLQSDCLILNDLLLKVNNTTFQIDSLIIFAEVIYLFEVKNFEGDYFYESGKFYMKPKIEINNPLTQLSRAESLLRQLLQNLGFHLPLHASVVFINPEFTLYQAPQDKPIIFPSQINRYLKKLDSKPSKLNGKHKALADKLIQQHICKSPYTLVPAYDYSSLKKGTTCGECGSLSVFVHGAKCVCGECGHEEKVDSAVMRSVWEFKLLFPDEKITSNGVYEWCGVVESQWKIRKILKKNFKVVGVHQWTYYE